MPKVLTQSSIIVCSHQGMVTLTPSQTKLKIDGQAALVMGDLAGKPIAGCTLSPSTNTTPCSATVAMSAGAAQKIKVGGKPVLLDTAAGTTNSVLPGTFSVSSAGQTKLGES